MDGNQWDVFASFVDTIGRGQELIVCGNDLIGVVIELVMDTPDRLHNAVLINIDSSLLIPLL